MQITRGVERVSIDSLSEKLITFTRVDPDRKVGVDDVMYLARTQHLSHSIFPDFLQLSTCSKVQIFVKSQIKEIFFSFSIFNLKLTSAQF